MDKKEFEQLVEYGLLTEVGVVSDYIDNPSKLETLDVEDLANSGVIPQPVVCTELAKNGIDILDEPYFIRNQSDFEQYLQTKSYIRLQNDIQLDTTIVFNGDCTIDLNGHNITAGVFTESNGEFLEGNNDSFVFWVKGGRLTIEGDGKLIAKDAQYSMAIWCTGGEVNIYGGSYYNGGEGCDLIYASGTGCVNIYGGYYETSLKTPTSSGTNNNRSALNIKDRDRQTASINVYGGKFLEFDPSNNLSEGPNTNFVEDGYTTINAGTIYIVK